MKTFKHIFSFLALSLLMGLLSCNKEGGELKTQKEVKCVLVNIDSQKSLRLKSSEQDPTPEEELINTLRVYAFVDGELVGHYYQSGTIKTRFLLDMVFAKSEKVTFVHNFNFYVIANEKSLITEEDMPVIDEHLSEEQISNLRFISVDTKQGLPMSCCIKNKVLDIADLRDMSSLDPELTEGHQVYSLLTQSLNFELSKPLGKITFGVRKKSDQMDDVHLKSVTMLARGTRHYNYLMPQTDDFLKTLSARLNDRPIMPEYTTHVVKEASDYEEVATVYCAEVPYGSPVWNIPNNDNSIVIRVEYSIGEGTELRTNYIYLPAVHRNEWIQIRCTIGTEGTISLSYSVKDWEDNEVNDDEYIVFDYPTHTYLLPDLPTEANPSPDPDPVGGQPVNPVMSISKPFSCYFQLLNPVGQKWSPTIIKVEGASSTNYSIRVYLVSGSETVEITDDDQLYEYNEDKNTYYRIDICPKDSRTIGAKVYFGITSEISGFGHAEYLLINGSQSELFWPLAGGTDPNKLIITQVE